MTTEQITKNFNKTIETWEKALDNYTNSLFSLKPDDENWAMGQVCQHLILRTRGVFGIIEKCVSGD